MIQLSPNDIKPAGILLRGFHDKMKQEPPPADVG